jgi:high-affinity iron transporter
MRRWLPIAAAMLCVAIAVFFGLTALGVGDRAGSARGASSERTLFGTYTPEAPHVFSGLGVYPAGHQSEPPPDDLLIAAAAFTGPVDRYRVYALHQLAAMSKQIVLLEGALAADDRAAAQAAWRGVYTSYLRVGAVYLDGETASRAEVAALNQEINGNAGGLEGGASSPSFRGLHRIEMGLWTGAAPRSLLALTQRLDGAVRRLHSVLGQVSIAPLEYATRAHEILEDAVRDLLSGADVPWSDEGVLATRAGLEATEEVISTMRPLLPFGQHILNDVDAELAIVRSAIASIAAAHGGRAPTDAELTQDQSELLNGTLEGALEALAQVPGALETERPPHIPRVPQSDFRIDP